ncbi:MAG: hypothetical protein IPL78_00130 [Chloroflexi bacterium]|nr:hypothetical protein [Chloroflexota bacterium]
MVDSVDALQGEITFWLNGFDELQTVPIVPVMPGWLLRPEVEFRTAIPRACMKKRSLANNTSWGFFHPQVFSYYSEDQLIEELAKVLS